MKRLLPLGAVLANLVVLTVLAVPAGADAPEAAGWWSRMRIGPLLPRDTPSTVPEGGLYVAGDPTGPIGVSALRVTVGDRAVEELVLVVDNAQGPVTVRACPTIVVWTPEQGGPLSSAPEGDCAVADVVAAAENGVVRLAVGPLVREGVLNVVLEPQPGAVFQAAFAPPDDATVVTARSPSADTGDPAPAPFAVGATGSAFPDLPGPVAAPAASPSSAPAAAVPPAAPAATRAAVMRGESPRTRVIATLVLVDLVLAYLWLSRHSLPLPAALARRVAPPVEDSEPAAVSAPAHGVGRFARPRLGPVPRL
jgi:hypothetical protein